MSRKKDNSDFRFCVADNEIGRFLLVLLLVQVQLVKVVITVPLKTHQVVKISFSLKIIFIKVSYINY